MVIPSERRSRGWDGNEYTEGFEEIGNIPFLTLGS